MENEVYEGVPAIADDTLLAVAKMAEARIDAVIKIKQLALKVTNPRDWNDQQGNPYLQVSGAEKIANLFNISWQIDEPIMDEESDGAITYTYKGRFSLGGRTIEVEGSRSSRDEFFKKYIWENGKKTGEKPLDRRDLKMAAMTNLLGNGITRILGIRNLSWEDLGEFAGIKKEDVGKVEYKTKGEKPPLTQPGKKSDKEIPKEEGEGKIIVGIKDVTSKSGTKKDGTAYTISTILGADGQKYGTFDKKFADLASCAQDTGAVVVITYTEGKFGRNVTNLTNVEPSDERQPGEGDN